ncbi:hypothetical protein TI39_contig353g00024 [Zymoseptoria brevis]|uniref:Uncharacterized protein n=1 Tax=Zymoseptoria brevis TaxID=1047168 RepID=A0A0F4GU19_9PEZI|nr:hypothetical protein TI39_contig353g00024 [Zymoseptoria brevis]
MPPTTALSSPLLWKCPQCTIRALSTSARQLAVGPEHPKYIEVPEPPQQNLLYSPRVKGVLPVPRDIFAGKTRDQSDSKAIAEATRRPRKARAPLEGTREEWKVKMSEVRRRNLREGLESLRSRHQTEKKRMSDKSLARQREREELLARPEREDERLTAPSTSLDLQALLHGTVPDPTRRQRLAMKRINVETKAAEKQQERLDALHTLYMNARSFIVTPEQLDKAVDEAFGTQENPKRFGSTHMGPSAALSIWGEGRPERVQDMLNAANGVKSRSAMDSTSKALETSKDRINTIAEVFTGGKMDKEARD